MLPPGHPQRLDLNDEVHARPPEAMSPPLRISYLALLTDTAQREASWQAVVDLAHRMGAQPPVPGANHYSADLGEFRIKWERHTEFHRVMVLAPGGPDPFAAPAIDAVPADWVAALPGQLMVAAHVALLPAEPEPPDIDAIAERMFAGNVLLGDGSVQQTTSGRFQETVVAAAAASTNTINRLLLP